VRVSSFNIFIVMLAFCLSGCEIVLPVETHADSGHSLSTITPAKPPPIVESEEPEEPEVITATEVIEPDPVCVSTTGQLIEISYPAYLLEQELLVQVFLPPCYHESEANYPAVYFFHGSPPESADWIKLGTIERMNEALQAQTVTPAIMFFPLLPEELFVRTDGGTGSYEDEFIHGLMPSMENKFRTNNFNALAGISRGAIWAAEISLAHSDLIHAVAILSPAFQYNSPRPAYDPFEMVRTADQIELSFFIVAGDDDWALDETEAFTYLLERKNVTYDFMIFEGGHQESLWVDSIMPVLQYFYRSWNG